MAKTTEKEWANHIIENWGSYGKPWITKEDVLNNPLLLGALNSEDVLRSASRNEPAYKQQIGNIVSHKNVKFDFKKIGGRDYFRPKEIKETAIQEFDNDLVLSIETGANPAELLARLKSRPKAVAKRKAQKIAKYESSQQLKDIMKAIIGHKCELGCDMNINSFITNEKHYTEAHHIIPLKNQGSFDVSLDVQDNLVILCPKHHRQFHLAKKTDLVKLYSSLSDNHKDFVSSLGIEPKDLINYY